MHNAEHDHITPADVSTVSKWAAWVVLEYVTLVARGIETRAAAKTQIRQMSSIIATQRRRKGYVHRLVNTIRHFLCRSRDN